MKNALKLADRILRFQFAQLLAAALMAQSPLTPEAFDATRTVEQIRVNGLRNVQEATVLRQMKSRVGEPYLPSNVAKDHERLDRMALFSKILIEAAPGANGVILRVELKETSPYLPYPSIGLTGEQGLTVGAGLKSTNFLGSGANLSTLGRFGGANEFEFIATSAWRPQKSWWWKVEYFLRDRNNKLDNFKEFSNELDLQAGRQVTDRLRVGGRFGLLSVKSDIPGVTLSADNHDNVPAVGLLAEYDSRDSWTNPKRGWLNKVDASANGLFADGDFWTFNFDVRRYQPIAGRHGLAMFSLLTLNTGTVGKNIPAWADFHIGGTNSMRGWEINARHGKHQLLNTLEYRYDLVKVRDFSIMKQNLYGGVRLVAFVDTGSAWNTGGEFSKNFIGGAGFGIHLLVPYVRLLRLDFGFGQSGRSVIPAVGVLEKADFQRRRVR